MWIDSVNWDKTTTCPLGTGYELRPQPVHISAIVLHSTNGQFGSTLEHEATYLRDTPTVSAHYLAGKNGEILELLPPWFRAWHAGISSYEGESDWNNFAVGIENHHAIGETWTPLQLAALRWLCQRLMRQYAIKHDQIVLHRWIAPGRKTDPDDIDDNHWRGWIAAL